MVSKLKFGLFYFCSIKKWLAQRLSSIEEIRDMANELHGHQKNVNIARVTGTSVGMHPELIFIIFLAKSFQMESVRLQLNQQACSNV